MYILWDNLCFLCSVFVTTVFAYREIVELYICNRNGHCKGEKNVNTKTTRTTKLKRNFTPFETSTNQKFLLLFYELIDLLQVDASRLCVWRFGCENLELCIQFEISHIVQSFSVQVMKSEMKQRINSVAVLFVNNHVSWNVEQPIIMKCNGKESGSDKHSCVFLSLSISWCFVCAFCCYLIRDKTHLLSDNWVCNLFGANHLMKPIV